MIDRVFRFLVIAMLTLATCTHRPRPLPSDQWPRPAQPKAGMIAVAEARRWRGESMREGMMMTNVNAISEEIQRGGQRNRC